MKRIIVIILFFIIFFGFSETEKYEYELFDNSNTQTYGAIKGVINLPDKSLRKVIRKRRSRGYSRSVLSQAKKAVQYNEYEKSMIYLIPLDEKNYKVREDQAILSQKDVSFQPAHLVVQRNQEVNVLNRDNIFHNVFSNSDVKQFNIGKVRTGVDKVITFESTGHIQVFCDIHAFMSSIISIVDTPYFTTGNKDGSFEIRNVPEGRYRLIGWHSNSEFSPAIIDIKNGRFTNVKNLVFK